MSIHPSSSLARSKPAVLVYSELVKTTKCYMRWVLPLVIVNCPRHRLLASSVGVTFRYCCQLLALSSVVISIFVICRHRLYFSLSAAFFVICRHHLSLSLSAAFFVIICHYRCQLLSSLSATFMVICRHQYLSSSTVVVIIICTLLAFLSVSGCLSGHPGSEITEMVDRAKRNQFYACLAISLFMSCCLCSSVFRVSVCLSVSLTGL